MLAHRPVEGMVQPKARPPAPPATKGFANDNSNRCNCSVTVNPPKRMSTMCRRFWHERLADAMLLGQHVTGCISVHCRCSTSTMNIHTKTLMVYCHCPSRCSPRKIDDKFVVLNISDTGLLCCTMEKCKNGEVRKPIKKENHFKEGKAKMRKSDTGGKP